MDVLSDAVAAMRVGTPHASRNRREGPWGIQFPASPGAGVHAVLAGTVWLLPPGEKTPALRLRPGDLVFLAQGAAYALASDLSAPLVPFAEDRPSDAEDPGTPAEHPGSPKEAAGTLVLCGAYHLDRGAAHPLLAELPDVVHLSTDEGRYPQVRAVLDLLDGELAAPRAGSAGAVHALLDTLLLYVLRAWWLTERTRQGPPPPTGWAAALGDAALTTALRAMHEHPGRPWTVASLAAEAGLSRAAFARRFTSVLAVPPLGYLTWWRMVLAARLLRGSEESLRGIAQRTGYTAEFAFAKAFRRVHGVPPGTYRRRAPGRAERPASLTGSTRGPLP
ncbi:AraC family transcriptional regulator [Streptomyces sp. NPDC007088]|uniref:AraC family transcriptional regulator n=1 Tax=Streptomyces sp. NPDC007088 TaxID=3364773 RepID=UPI0036D01758